MNEVQKMGDLTMKATGLGAFHHGHRTKDFDLSIVDKEDQILSSLKLRQSMQADGGTLNSSYLSAALKASEGVADQVLVMNMPDKPSLFKPSERSIVPSLKFSTRVHKVPSPLQAPRPSFVATRVAPTPPQLPPTNKPF